MRIAELSAAERNYLESPLPVAETLSPLLIRHFSRVLGARIKQGVQVKVGTPQDPNLIAELIDTGAPVFSWDDALDIMWLQARLGGSPRTLLAPCSAMTKNLLRTLQVGLAETWISLSDAKTLPAALTLHIEITAEKINVAQAVLTIRFPPSLSSMNQWAQQIIRHAI